MKYDVLIIGAGPGGIFSAYELMQRKPEWKVAVLEAGNPLEKRHCPIDGDKVKSCIHCKTCAIMNGFGGAGAFSDGKYNLTNEFGGTLYEYIGKQKAMELMRYVDEINVACGGAGTKLYSTADSGFKRLCLQNNLHLLDASVRHLGTDINYKVLENLYAQLKEHIDFHFLTPVKALTVLDDGSYQAETDKGTFCGSKGRPCARRWISPPSPIAWTSASGWSCPPRCSPPSPTSCTRARSCIRPRSIRTRCARSA